MKGAAEKTIFTKILNHLTAGGLIVKYWDGSQRHYGPASEPYFTLIIRHPRALRAIAKNISLGFGEAYMDGDIEIEGDLRQPIRLLAENSSAFKPLTSLPVRLNRNKRSRQQNQIQHHYDLGNDFYRLWLDDSMTYSCAYFTAPEDTLEQAQDNKRHYILRKLQLQPGMTLLDIGSGWGQLLIDAAQYYGVRGHGVTLSQEQYDHTRARIQELGLQDQITIELCNYQDLATRNLTFDRVVSVGMYEHVGRGNHARYFQAVNQLLVPGGISVLHTITGLNGHTDPWIDRYIFPGGYLPYVDDTIKVLTHHNFELQDYENLRYHYARTLEEWLRRYEAHRDQVLERYDERFYRMWRLYLASCAGNFRYGGLNLSQFVMTKGLPPREWPLTRAHLYQTEPAMKA